MSDPLTRSIVVGDLPPLDTPVDVALLAELRSIIDRDLAHVGASLGAGRTREWLAADVAANIGYQTRGMLGAPLRVLSQSDRRLSWPGRAVQGHPLISLLTRRLLTLLLAALEDEQPAAPAARAPRRAAR